MQTGWIFAKWKFIHLARFEVGEEILDFQVIYGKEGCWRYRRSHTRMGIGVGACHRGFYDIQRSFADSIVRLFSRWLARNYNSNES